MASSNNSTSSLKTNPHAGEQPARPDEQLPLDLSSALSSPTSLVPFDVWIIGASPLICHAWSEKARLEMLTTQVKAAKGKGREQRDPQRDFINSLYHMPDDEHGRKAFGFPATGVKKAILASAHKDKGLARSIVTSSLWINAKITPVRTALAGAVCDLPLVRIYGSEPVMREDMVRVGVGLSKKSSLAYRAQFTHWAINLRGRFNRATISEAQLGFLIREAGYTIGIGDWRNEKTGVFGAFELATPKEGAAWRAYANATGPLPAPSALTQAA
jgi:hypothetical protein